MEESQEQSGSNQQSGMGQRRLLRLRTLKGLHLHLFEDQLDPFRSQTDTNIICADGIVPAHRCMLMICSPMLREHFANTSLSEVHNIHLPDVETHYVAHVLSILYTGHTSLSKDERTNVLETLRLLGMFNDIKLQQRNLRPYEESQFKPVRYYNAIVEEYGNANDEMHEDIVKIEPPEDEDVVRESHNTEVETFDIMMDTQDQDQNLVNDEIGNDCDNHFECFICKTGFSSENDLHTHMATVSCVAEMQLGVSEESIITNGHCSKCNSIFFATKGSEFIDHVNECGLNSKERRIRRAQLAAGENSHENAMSHHDHDTELVNNEPQPGPSRAAYNIDLGQSQIATPRLNSTSQATQRFNSTSQPTQSMDSVGIMAPARNGVGMTPPVGVRMTRSSTKRSGDPIVVHVEKKRKYARKGQRLSAPTEKKKSKTRRRTKSLKHRRGRVANVPTPLPNSIAGGSANHSSADNTTLGQAITGHSSYQIPGPSTAHDRPNIRMVDNMRLFECNRNPQPSKKKNKKKRTSSQPNTILLVWRRITVDNKIKEAYVVDNGQIRTSFTPNESFPLGRQLLDGQLYDAFGSMFPGANDNEEFDFEPHFYTPVKMGRSNGLNVTPI